MSFLKPIPSRPPETANSAAEGYVCWSRMQAEAGQALDAIVKRKERERQAGGGVFLWGVGNAPAVAISQLARLRMPIPIVFSTMKSKPKAVDMAPSRTVVWRRYVDENGIERPLPKSALVTSRGDSASGAKTKHYALMCYSDRPLMLTRGVPFDPAAFRNVGGAGAPVGASQVTALLKQVAELDPSPAYEANVIAWLTGGYWVRLSDPRELGAKAIADIAAFEGDTDEWLAFVARVRGSGKRNAPREAEALLL
jgi:hypothetical protein